MKPIDWLLLGFCLFLFASSATTDILLPGPHGDEVLHACLAIDLTRPPHPFGHYTLHWGNQPFPFGVDSHTGALKAYLLWPFFALLGPSVELQRMFTIFLGLWILIFCYLFISENIDRGSAFFVTLLLSLDSSFLFYSKLDAGPIIEKLLWMVVCLWTSGRFVRTHRFRYLVVGSIAGIFGIYSHIAFVWFAGAYTIAALLFYRSELLRVFKKPALYLVIPSMVCFLTIFLYWLIGETNLLSKNPPGFSGAFIMFERVSTLGGIVPDVLLGKHMEVIPLLDTKVRPLTDVFLIVSTLFLLCCRGVRLDVFKFLFFVSGIILLEMSYTPADYVIYPHRMMVFYLFLIFFGGIAVAQGVKFLKDFKGQSIGLNAASIVILLAAIVSVYGQVSFKQEADQKIRQTGGKWFWSDQMVMLAGQLEGDYWKEIVCLDWGFRGPLSLLTKGKIPLTEPFWGVTVTEERKWKMLSQMIQEASPQTLFLMHPRRMWSGGFDVKDFKKAAQMIGKELNVEHVFHEREGDLVYFAYTIK